MKTAILVILFLLLMQLQYQELLAKCRRDLEKAAQETDQEPTSKRLAEIEIGIEDKNENEIVREDGTEEQEVWGQEEDEEQEKARTMRKDTRRAKRERKRLREENENDDERRIKSKIEEEGPGGGEGEEEEEEKSERKIRKEARRGNKGRERLRVEIENDNRIIVKSEKVDQEMEMRKVEEEEVIASLMSKETRREKRENKRLRAEIESRSENKVIVKNETKKQVMKGDEKEEEEERQRMKRKEEKREKKRLRAESENDIKVIVKSETEDPEMRGQEEEEEERSRLTRKEKRREERYGKRSRAESENNRIIKSATEEQELGGDEGEELEEDEVTPYYPPLTDSQKKKKKDLKRLRSEFIFEAPGTATICLFRLNGWTRPQVSELVQKVLRLDKDSFGLGKSSPLNDKIRWEVTFKAKNGGSKEMGRFNKARKGILYNYRGQFDNYIKLVDPAKRKKLPLKAASKAVPQLRGNMKIGALNINGLGSKFQELGILLQSHGVGICALTQTKLESTSLTKTVPGYELWVQHSGRSAGERGLAIAIRTDLLSMVYRVDTSTPNIMSIKINGSQPFIFSCVYIPHRSAQRDLERDYGAKIRSKEELVLQSNRIGLRYPDTIHLLAGDCNMHTEELSELLGQLNRECTIKRSEGDSQRNCKKGEKEVAIDHLVVVGEGECMLENVQVDSRSRISDHFLVTGTVMVEASKVVSKGISAK